MVKFYRMQIELKKMTIEEVPERWRKEVGEISGRSNLLEKNDRQENYIEVKKTEEE